MRKLKNSNKIINVSYEDDDKEPPIFVKELQSLKFDLKNKQSRLEISADILENQRQTLSRLYDVAPVSYFILDLLGVIEEVNKTGTELFGLSKLALQNKRFQSFILPEDTKSFALFLNNIKEDSSKKNIEIKLLLPDKRVIYAHLEGIMIRDSAFNAQYYLTVIDITVNRKADLELKEIKNRLEMTLKACSTGTWRIENGENRIILDEYSHEILGLPPSSFQGTVEDFVKYVQLKERSKVLKAILYALKTSSDFDMEFQIITENGYKKHIHSKGQHIVLSKDKILFAGIIMDITAQKKLFNESENLKSNQQKRIFAATLAAQESERNNISRALHDSVCQLLYGIKLNLQCIPELKRSKVDLSNINKLLDQAIKETRDLSYALTPSVLKDFGFTAGIKEMSQRLSTSTFKINSLINSSIDQLQPIIQLHIFRIIQELINNCIKHASASKVLIVIKEEEEKIKVIVSDNGKGFKTGVSETFKNGSGLRSIKNQIFLLNGELTFRSTKNRTTVCLIFNKNIDFY